MVTVDPTDDPGWLDFGPSPHHPEDEMPTCANCRTPIAGEWLRYDRGVVIEWSDGLVLRISADVNLCSDLCRFDWLDDRRAELVSA